MEELLDVGTAEAQAQAVRAFSGDRLTQIERSELVAIVRRVTDAGLPDGLRFYLRLLEQPGRSLGGKTWDLPVSQVFAQELLEAWDAYGQGSGEKKDPELARIAAQTAGKPERAVARVKSWAAAKLRTLPAR